MNIAFVTCVELGFSCIKKLNNSGIEINLIITLDDNLGIKKSGRVYLDGYCEENKIKLLKINNINEEIVYKTLTSLKIDWLFIVGWSQIAKEKLLKTPFKGVLGIHPTLLPQGRGRASIPWAIIKNLNKTGATLFKLDTGVDTGPIYDQVEIKIGDRTNATELYQEINNAHLMLIEKISHNILQNNINFYKQKEEQATVWPQRKLEDGLIDLKGSIFNAERLIRATTKPYPGAFYFEENRKIIVWKSEIIKNVKINNKYLSFFDGDLLLKEIEIINN